MSTTASPCRLTVTLDGITQVGMADPARTLLENIETLQLPIRSACRRGRCGSCRVRLLSGRLHPEFQLLRDSYVLSCSSRLDGDAHIEVPRRAPPPAACTPIAARPCAPEHATEGEG